MSRAIYVDALGKRYFIGRTQQQSDRLGERLSKLMRSPLRRASRLLRGEVNSAAGLDEVLWALRDVSFEMHHGEALGIIGHNGAGKSTLLKILSGITEPTEGIAEIHGRVGSLLEIGTGFHPDLTGRENIYLNSAILGMKKREIEQRFDEIVSFAELEHFLETPVKHYSSGMYMRLGFAIAAHLNPEILLVDEVLAVGDVAFQQKCLGKMESITEDGRTILFVSHNMLAIKDICEKVMWLHEGNVREFGPAKDVVSSYLQTSLTTLYEQCWDEESALGNDHIRLKKVAVYPSGDLDRHPMTVRQPLTVEIEYWNLNPGARMTMNLQLYNEQGILVFEAGPIQEPIWRPLSRALYRDRCFIPGDLLNDGTYRIAFYAARQRGGVVFRADDLLIFNVQDVPDLRGGWHGEWQGVIRPILEWQRQKVEQHADHQ